MNVDNQINKLLTQWDPIEIASASGPVDQEYKMYIPRIKAVLHDQSQIQKLLKHIVSVEMGLDYDETNPEQRNEIEELSAKLHALSPQV